MNGYRRMWTGWRGVALALAAVGCAAEPVESQESETPQAATTIMNPWINQNFKGLIPGTDLNGQLGWEPVLPDQHSPIVWPIGRDGATDQGVKLVNKEEGVDDPEAFTSSRQFAKRPTTARYQHLVFQVRVNAEVPQVSSNKAGLVLHKVNDVPLLKVYFQGTNLRLCGSDDSDCDNVFPGHDGFPCAGEGPAFDHAWYRVVVFIDRKTDGVHTFEDGKPWAYAEVGLVGNECVLSRTRSVQLDNDPIASLVLYEYSHLGGAVLVDSILGGPSDNCCKL